MTTAVITGASSGIGLATARLFLEHRYEVYNLSRRPCPDTRVNSVKIDLSSPRLAVNLKRSLLSQLDLTPPTEIHLIHNAAKLHSDTALATTDETLQEVMQVNVFAPNTLNRLLIPHMAAGSSIVLVGSTLAEKAVANVFSYVTSKHAVVGMMRALCQDLAGTEVHVSCICPGFTDTEMLRSRIPEDNLNDVAQMSTFQRLVQPEEIAQSIFWATQNPVLNGSVIHANLGQKEQ
ncbi:MAG: SDR family oxidoreductase [Gammaproteobacteria bacterium]|nr:SDR family oxidoreductase [Gammaproteobacteria bacterium]MYF38747.1 SDR family oxidoreductase [Gammaproteobacteria bacterium]